MSLLRRTEMLLSRHLHTCTHIHTCSHWKRECGIHGARF